MRIIILAFSLVFGFATASAAQDASGENTDVQAVIAAQIEAFLAEDVDTAFTYASPFIQRMFNSGTKFLEGVIEKLSDDEIDMLIHIFSRTSEIFEDYPGPFRVGPDRR